MRAADELINKMGKTKTALSQTDAEEQDEEILQQRGMKMICDETSCVIVPLAAASNTVHGPTGNLPIILAGTPTCQSAEIKNMVSSLLLWDIKPSQCSIRICLRNGTCSMSFLGDRVHNKSHHILLNSLLRCYEPLFTILKASCGRYETAHCNVLGARRS